MFAASLMQKLGPSAARVEAYICAAQPEPSREAREHSIGSKTLDVAIGIHIFPSPNIAHPFQLKRLG